jgi:hypothetical protein
MTAESAWLYGDMGRKVLGPNSLSYLARSIRGFSSAVEGLAEKTLGGRPSNAAAARLQIRLEQMQKMSDILFSFWSANRRALTERGFTLPSSLNSDSTSFGTLPWTKATWTFFESLNYSPDLPITVLEGLTWGDLLDEAEDASVFFDVIQMLNDWLPFAVKEEMLVNLDETLGSAVNSFQREVCVRAAVAGSDVISYQNLLARRHGWGIDAETLRQISSAHDISPERIRQIESRLLMTAASRSRKPWRILESIAETVVEDKLFDVDQQVIELNGISDYWSVDSLRSFMTISGSPGLGDQLFANSWLTTEEALENNQKVRALRKARSLVGVIKLDTVVVPELNRVMSVSEATALTRKVFGSTNIYGEYAIVSNAANMANIYTAVANQLSVCNPLHFDQVMEGVRRAAKQRTAHNTLPDRDSFLALLRQSEDFDVSDALMVTGREISHEFGTISSWLVDLISSQDGFVISKAQVFRLALANNVKLSSLNVYVTFQSTIRSPRDGFLTLVGHTPTNADLEFAKRVADAIAVPNSRVECRGSADGDFFVEFTLSTTFLVSGAVSAPALLKELFGKSKRKVKCCSGFNEGSNSHVSINSGFLTGLAPVRDHLLSEHGFREGHDIRLEIDESFCQVLI